MRRGVGEGEYNACNCLARHNITILYILLCILHNPVLWIRIQSGGPVFSNFVDLDPHFIQLDMYSLNSKSSSSATLLYLCIVYGTVL